MTATSNILRWIHIIILVPVLARLELEKRGWFVAAIFPRIFQLATIVVATVLVAEGDFMD